MSEWQKGRVIRSEYTHPGDAYECGVCHGIYVLGGAESFAHRVIVATAEITPEMRARRELPPIEVLDFAIVCEECAPSLPQA